MKLKLIIPLVLSLTLLLGVYFVRPSQKAQAEKLTILNGNLYSTSQALEKKQFTNQADLKILFDYNSHYALVGKAWEGEVVANSESTGGTNLFLINLLDKSEQKISNDLVRWADLDPKNTLIYFTDAQQNLWRHDINQSSQEKIMDKVFSPDLSLDGRFMVYQKLNPDWIAPYTDQALGLTVLDLDTRQEVRITNRWEDWLPLWTPDGQKVLFFSTNDQGTSSHFVIDRDGQNKKQLSNFGLHYIKDNGLPMPSEKPIWSPDGTMLLYESDHAIWLNQFNAEKNQLTGKFLTYGQEATWSQNGQVVNVILNNSQQTSVQSINVDLTGKIIKK